ncbi:uncharacterized protein TRIVIDRAFT_216086 [Trichoderma virens Gv29-8]|uniref:Uncharacterized protein n=1 Tax=Hypocrea virens (strain Gv29-8 / FGSC 10586) TaxID=413071 RepID=G9MRG5_HYPVG|nr:uncharacterized protein TRIVIDRAFT_216086 [Trichoderma virens Gv29-8]EHK22687.1 hypothetical protein TRIVIDRAFT_216086 [Trichoderma virens Gv29-8]
MGPMRAVYRRRIQCVESSSSKRKKPLGGRLLFDIVAGIKPKTTPNEFLHPYFPDTKPSTREK